MPGRTPTCLPADGRGYIGWMLERHDSQPPGRVPIVLLLALTVVLAAVGALVWVLSRLPR
jgi:hypothetical protein